MIFAGHPIKLISPSYANRVAMMEMRERKSLDQYLTDMWIMRDREQLTLSAPKTSISWPICREEGAVEGVVKMRKGAR